MGSLYIEAQGYDPVLLENYVVCIALELGPSVVLGFSVGMEAFDELLSINVAWSQEFSCSQDLDCLWFSVLFLQ